MQVEAFVKRLILGLTMVAGAGTLWAQSGFIFQPLTPGAKAGNGVNRDNHASTVVELRNGDVMAAWFGGTKEGAPDVAIYGAQLHDGKWSVATELARANDVACWNPVLFHTKDGKLWL